MVFELSLYISVNLGLLSSEFVEVKSCHVKIEIEKLITVDYVTGLCDI